MLNIDSWLTALKADFVFSEDLLDAVSSNNLEILADAGAGWHNVEASRCIARIQAIIGKYTAATIPDEDAEALIETLDTLVECDTMLKAHKAKLDAVVQPGDVGVWLKQRLGYPEDSEERLDEAIEAVSAFVLILEAWKR